MTNMTSEQIKLCYEAYRKVNPDTKLKQWDMLTIEQREQFIADVHHQEELSEKPSK